MTRDFRRYARAGAMSIDFAREMEAFDWEATVDAIDDDRILENSVTQHEAALSIATTQLTGAMPDARIVESNVTQHQGALTISAAQVTGAIPDGQVSESAVTQHEAALSIAFTQLTGQIADAQVPSSAVTQHSQAWYVAAVENTDTTTDLSGTGVTIPINGGTVHVDAAEYSTSGSGIEVTTAGRHRVSAVVDSTGDPITLRFSVNGTPTGPIGSGTITAILDLSASDVVTVEASGAVNTTTLAASGTSSLTVETWR